MIFFIGKGYEAEMSEEADSVSEMKTEVKQEPLPDPETSALDNPDPNRPVTILKEEQSDNSVRCHICQEVVASKECLGMSESCVCSTVVTLEGMKLHGLGLDG